MGHGDAVEYLPITSYKWEFGDGTTASGSGATEAHAYASAGEYEVKLTVDDGEPVNHSSSITKLVTVRDTTPPETTIDTGPSAPLSPRIPRTGS